MKNKNNPLEIAKEELYGSLCYLAKHAKPYAAGPAAYDHAIKNPANNSGISSLIEAAKEAQRANKIYYKEYKFDKDKEYAQQCRLDFKRHKPKPKTKK